MQAPSFIEDFPHSPPSVSNSNFNRFGLLMQQQTDKTFAATTSNNTPSLNSSNSSNSQNSSSTTTQRPGVAASFLYKLTEIAAYAYASASDTYQTVTAGGGKEEIPVKKNSGREYLDDDVMQINADDSDDPDINDDELSDNDVAQCSNSVESNNLKMRNDLDKKSQCSWNSNDDEEPPPPYDSSWTMVESTPGNSVISNLSESAVHNVSDASTPISSPKQIQFATPQDDSTPQSSPVDSSSTTPTSTKRKQIRVRRPRRLLRRKSSSTDMTNQSRYDDQDAMLLKVNEKLAEMISQGKDALNSTVNVTEVEIMLAEEKERENRIMKELGLQSSTTRRRRLTGSSSDCDYFSGSKFSEPIQGAPMQNGFHVVPQTGGCDHMMPRGCFNGPLSSAGYGNGNYGPNAGSCGHNVGGFVPNQNGFGANSGPFGPNMSGFVPNVNGYGPNANGYGPNSNGYMGSNLGVYGPNANGYTGSKGSSSAPNANGYGTNIPKETKNMVLTPKLTNKKIISNTDQIKTFSDDSNKVNMSPSIKLEEMNDTILFDEWLANDLENFLSKTDDFLFTPKTINHDVSPVVSSSMNIPLTFNNISNSHESDSPLFTSDSKSFSKSPSLDPAKKLFPDLSDDNSTSKSIDHNLASSVPAVAITADDQLSLPICQPDYTSALNIPWESDSINTSDFLSNKSSSFTSTLTDNTTDLSSNGIVKAKTSPTDSITTTTTSPTESVPTSPVTKTTTNISRKRSVNEIEKDPKTIAEELAIKRAKNTDAARRSRLRKVLKMESLEKQVNELKIENKKFQTRVAVLESEKKGLKEKNNDKDNRIKLLEKQLAESHE
ncbi:19397_t:CDS:2, partial [Dentiscutata erythropus]